jgi:IPT/TIG domain
MQRTRIVPFINLVCGPVAARLRRGPKRTNSSHVTSWENWGMVRVCKTLDRMLGGAAMREPLLCSLFCSKAGSVLCLIALLLSGGRAALGQEKLIAPVQGTISVVDPTTLNADEVVTAGASQNFALVGANPRLGYVGASDYLSVIDFTLGREVNRIYGVCPYLFGAFTSDQKYLLVEDECGYGYFHGLTVVNVTTGKVVRRLNLSRVLGYGAYYLGSVVVAGNRVYVTSQYGDPVHPPIAVLDLGTFRLRPVNVPGGYIDFSSSTPNAAVTPDQKYLVMVEDLNSDGSSHLYVISAATDKVVLDQPLMSFDPSGLVITPVNAAGKVYGYLLGYDYGQNQFSVTVIDLNEGSKTFGQPLPQTEVSLDAFFPSSGSSAAAINGDGSQLVVGGYQASIGSSPNPNVVELDTAQMLVDPSKAIVGSATFGGGGQPGGMTIATISETSPPTAPTVTKVSPATITNDIDNTLTVTGTNFASGASVRSGTFSRLPATVQSSTSLQVTVPKNFPAQASLDVVVTNPLTNGSPSQQYQSGILPASLTVFPNPLYQPKNQFAALNQGTYSVSVYESGQQTMINVPNAIVPSGIAFSTDGAGIYAPSNGPRGVNSKQVAEWSPLDDSLKAQVPISGVQRLIAAFGEMGLAPSLDPNSGDPVIFVPVSTISSGNWDVGVQMVDTKTNTVTKTLEAGLNVRGYAYANGLVATPDGKYVYVDANIYQSGNNLYLILVFDVLHGTVTSLDAQTLGVSGYQVEMTVSPDGQSLLLQAASAGVPIAVFDIGVNPDNPTLVTTITGTPPPGARPFSFYSWKVAAGRLFALDFTQNILVAFNFDRAHNNFSQLNYYQVPLQYYALFMAVSPDGNLIYVPMSNYDFIAVLDANALVNGQDPLITNIGAFVAPYQVIVSPVAQLDENPRAGGTTDSSRGSSSNSAGRATPGVHGHPVGGGQQQPTHEVHGRGAYDVQ